jgi:hypothetical protein
MIRIIRYVAVLALLALFAPRGAEALQADVEIDDPAAPAERDIVAESHLHCLALAVFFEGGSTDETVEGQQFIARVVIERARERRRKWGGGDICDVVFYKRVGVCQFTFACLPLARRTPRGGQRWRQALAIARDTIESGSERQGDDIRYYMNPALTSDRNACRFRKEFVPVAKAGRHEFFREPTQAERAAIAVAQHAECVRYQAALEEQRRKAKAAAERKRLAAMKKKAKRSRVAKR